MTRPFRWAATTSRTPSDSALCGHFHTSALNRSLQQGAMRWLVTICLTVSILLLCNCNPTLHPAITATVNNVNQLTVKGTGFSNSNPCAHLSLVNPQPASIGDATCAGGTFNTIWSPNYVPGCQPNNSQSALVSAADIPTGDLTFATTSILWGTNCAIVGSCGKIGLRACPDPSHACYVDGGPDGSDYCVACGAEGQPVCTNSPACSPGFNPNLSGSITTCTASCGGIHQSPCITSGASYGVTYVYTCFNSTLAYGDCTCVPNTRAHYCPVKLQGAGCK
jgi:hypothetical protein